MRIISKLYLSLALLAGAAAAGIVLYALGFVAG